MADQNAKIAVYGIHVMANRWGLRIDFEAIMRRADAEGRCKSLVFRRLGAIPEKFPKNLAGPLRSKTEFRLDCHTK